MKVATSLPAWEVRPAIEIDRGFGGGRGGGVFGKIGVVADGQGELDVARPKREPAGARTEDRALGRMQVLLGVDRVRGSTGHEQEVGQRAVAVIGLHRGVDHRDDTGRVDGALKRPQPLPAVDAREGACEDVLVVPGEESLREEDDIRAGVGARRDELRGASDIAVDGAADGLGLDGSDADGHGDQSDRAGGASFVRAPRWR